MRRNKTGPSRPIALWLLLVSPAGCRSDDGGSETAGEQTSHVTSSSENSTGAPASDSSTGVTTTGDTTSDGGSATESTSGSSTGGAACDVNGAWDPAGVTASSCCTSGTTRLTGYADDQHFAYCAPECETNGDCSNPPGAIAVCDSAAGACVVPCEIDTDCPSAWRCYSGLGVAIARCMPFADPP